MPTWPSLSAFHADLTKALDIAELSKITYAIALKAQQIAEAAASADLGGDPKFSGWAPLLDTQIKRPSDGSAVLMPTRTSAGPWTVAEFGRNKGNASGFQGPGVNSRTGATARTKSGAVRKVRARQAKRWNGYTDPKHTASEAVARMEHELPTIAQEKFIADLLRHFDVT
jgi:hypothetical protein